MLVAVGLVAAAAIIAFRYERHARPSDPPVVMVRRPTPPDRDFDRVVLGAIDILPPIYFRAGSADLTPAARAAIEPVLATLSDEPRLALLELSAFADDRAGAAGALSLSRRRADAVRDYLVGRGVNAARLEACAYGLRHPAARNDAPEHRAENNRLTWSVLSMEAVVAPSVPTPATPSDPPRACPKVPEVSGAARVFGDQDRDGDGVPNPVDHCPSELRAASAAPRQPGCGGCLRTDLDGDGVYDDEDLCRTALPGDHPDGDRPGCPDGDLDGDRVFDSHDACPAELPGPRPDPEQPGCPARDRDGDTVPDAVDRCPDAVEGLRPDPSRAGCPVPDRDQDTVADAADACPDEPGAPSTVASRAGCPGLVAVSGDRLVMSQPLTFAPGAARWDAAGTATVDAAAAAVVASRWIYRVAVVGRAATAALALRRAEMVADWMAARGVSPCDVEAFGEVATEGEAVELRLLEQRVSWSAASSLRSTARYVRPRVWR